MRLNNKQLFCYLLPVTCYLLFLSCVSLSPVDGRAQRLVSAGTPEMVLPDWQFVPVLGIADDRAFGLAYCAGKVSKPRIQFNALRLDLADPDLRIMVRGGGGVSEDQFLSTRVSTFVRENGLIAGINALPFKPVSGKEGEPRVNVGVVITDGVLLSAPHRGFDALVLYADGSAAITAQAEMESAENITHAVGGFHRILQGSELYPRVFNLKDRHPRSAAGISADGRFLYLLVIDGRRPGSIGSTEAETALLLKALGASDGINFDGGGSTALALSYPDGKVRVANTPIHRQIPGRERAVAGCLGIGKAQFD